MLVKNDISKRAEELNVLAAQGKPLPDNLTSPEQLYFLALRCLYTDYRRQMLTIEQAKIERKKLSEAFIENMYNYDLYEHQSAVHAVYAKHFQEIRNNGCDVCNKLYKILCGLGLQEEDQNNVYIPH